MPLKKIIEKYDCLCLACELFEECEMFDICMGKNKCPCETPIHECSEFQIMYELEGKV